MRICHVSPHLPPDQAANALLPAELGAWLRAAGHDVSFVTQAPAQGKTADDSTLPGPVVRVAGRGTPSYFGPGAGPGPFHHYVFEFYALDIKLDTLATGASVTDLYAAIDGHVIGHQIMVVPFHQ